MKTSAGTTLSTTGFVLHRAIGYDFLVWAFTHGRTRAFRETLVSLARLKPGESVLDIGCGTGSLALAAKRHVGSNAEVTGLDASDEMIARAKSKARRRGIDVSFTHGIVEALPFEDDRFDVVLSTLMLHHLPRPARRRCASEIRRVLKPGGRVLVVDFPGQEKHGFLSHFHRHGHVDPRAVASLLEEAGLRRFDEGEVGIGSLQFVLAVRPA